VCRNGFCPWHDGRIVAAVAGQAGGLASGAARRAQAARVREAYEAARVAAGVELAQRERLRLDEAARARQREHDRRFALRKAEIIAAAQAELTEKTREQQRELERLRKQRKRLEVAA
jgi:hypothetical protein